MDRQPAAIHIIRLFTQEVEQLGVAHGNQEVKGIVRVAHNEKQGSFPVSQGIQFQLIIGRDLPQLRNIKYSKTRAAGNQDRFCGLASNKMSIVFSSYFLKFQKIKDWFNNQPSVNNQIYSSLSTQFPFLSTQYVTVL